MRDTSENRKAPRAQGSGSKRERKPGLWELIYKRRCQYFHGDRRGAEKALQAFVRQVDQTGTLIRQTATVAQLVDKYQRHLTNTVGLRARRDYATIFKTSVLPQIGDVRLRDVTPETIDELYAILLARGLAVTTVLKVSHVINGCFRQGVTWKWISDNPVTAATPPRARRRKVDVGDVAPVLALLHDIHIAYPAMGRFMKLLFAFGCRRGELCGFRLQDVDFASGVVRIAHNVVETEKDLLNPQELNDYEIFPIGDSRRVLVVKDTKTDEPRVFGIDPLSLGLLREQIQELELTARHVGKQLQPSAFLFSDNYTGRIPWRPDRVGLYWRRHRDKAGLSDRLHDLRHHNISQLLGAGVPLETVAARAGHRDSVVTARIYATPLPANDELAVAAMETLTRPKRPN